MVHITPDEVVPMSVLLMVCGREEGAGQPASGMRCVIAHPAHHPGLPLCFLLALLACAVARAEESMSVLSFSDAPPIVQEAHASAPPGVDTVAAPRAAADDTPSAVPPRMLSGDDDPDQPAPVYASMVMAQPVGESDNVPIRLASIDRVVERFSGPPRTAALHFDDASTATGVVDARARSMALAFDAPLSRSGGLTVQPRVEMAYRPGMAVGGSWDAPPGEATATGLAVRLYGSTPTRLKGVYPFVEADWWQDNRPRTININGTRIDTDLLRGMFSFNIGAHSNSTTGLKLWMKARGGRNAGGTVGARYRW